MKRISIIVPSLNQGEFIEKTITSLLEQSYPDLEILVMDGGSTDKTLSLLQKYAPKIKWVSEKDQGQADAINKGLRLCTGEVIGFVNSDDYLYSDALRIIADHFEDEKVLWLTGDYAIVDKEGAPIQSLIAAYKRVLRVFSSRNLLLVANFIVQPSTFWRRSLFETVGEFNDSLKYVMDYEYWIRAFSISKPKIIKQPLSAFRIHKDSKGGSQYKAQFDEEYLVCKRYAKNKFLVFLHKLHNQLIVFFYQFVK